MNPDLEKSNIDIKLFQQDLIGWFEVEQRSLPWRKNQDPYRIWVSEIMLQQTRVETVIPYYNRFMEQFPTIEALAKADEEVVLKAWEGLGYYSRVRNLQSAVREVNERYESKVPAEVEVISSLRGIGPYTAGAILSIAYGIPEPAVDGNVMRVLSRILHIFDDIAKPSTRKIFEQAVRRLISQENPSYFNQALMELGALICTPTSPSCLLCPVQSHCHAFQEGTQKQLPVKTKTKKQKKVQLVAGVLENEDGKLLIHKRANTGLLADLWEFPNVELPESLKHEQQYLLRFLQKEHGVEATIEHFICHVNHVFSHLEWNVHVFFGKIQSDIKETARLKLVTVDEISQFAFPVSHQKMLKAFFQQDH